MLKKRIPVVLVVASLALLLSGCDADPQNSNAKRFSGITAAHRQIESALGLLELTDDTDRRFDAVLDILKGLTDLKHYNESGAAYVEPQTTLLADEEWRVRLLGCLMLGCVGTGSAEAKEHLTEKLSDGDERVRFQAALALVRTGAPKPQCESIFREGLRHLYEPIRRDASWALDEMKKLGR
jgi:HEAT repeat protein